MMGLLAALALVTANPSVTFEWDPPSVGAAESYLVLYSQVGYDSETYTTTQPSITLQPVPGREISVRVAACAAGQCSEWSRTTESFSFNRSADLSGDGVVGLPDFVLLYPQIGQTSPDDLTGDGVIGLPDLTAWRARLGLCIGPVWVDGSRADAYLPCSLLGL